MVQLANDATRRRCFGGWGAVAGIIAPTYPPTKAGGFPPPMGRGRRFAPGKSPFGRWRCRAVLAALVTRRELVISALVRRLKPAASPDLMEVGAARALPARKKVFALWAKRVRAQKLQASPLIHPVVNRRAFLLNEKRSRLTTGVSALDVG